MDLAPVSGYQDRLTTRVRYNEVDSMTFVYYGVYLDWFTEGRTALMRTLGHSYAACERAGLFLPVLEVHCRYLAPGHYEDEVDIETTLTSCTPTRMHFRYRVSRAGDGVLLAEGETRHAFIDGNQRPVDLRKRFSEVWEVFRRGLTGTGSQETS